MGVIFIDSYDHYTTILQKYQSGNGCTPTAGYGRFGTAGVRSGHGTNHLCKALPSAKSTIYVGFAINPSSTPTARRALVSLFDGSASDWQASIWMLQGSGTIQGCRGSGTELGTSTGTVPIGSWSYLEVKFVISDTIGEIVVKCNGVTILELTGCDTKYTGNTTCTSVYLYGFTPDYNGQPNCDFDDLYIADDQFYGDCRVQCLVPTDVGNYSQWSPSTGANWQCVNEKPPDTGDYVATGTVGNIDTYAVENLIPTSGNVYAVQGCFYCQKTDAGSKQIAIATRLNSVDDAGAGIAVPSSWGFVLDIKTTKPGGGAWTIADINNAEMGMKMIA